jgi:ABC-type multidrug transport system fused ATPase/permease subunit
MTMSFNRYILSFARKLVRGFVGSSTKSLFLIPCPYLLKLIIDRYVPKREIDNILILSGICCLLIVTYVVVAIYSNRCIVRIVCGEGGRLRASIAAKLGTAQYGQVAGQFSSDLENLFFGDVQKIESCLVYLTNNFVPSVLYAFVMLFLVFFLDWRIGLLVVTLVAASLFARLALLRELTAAQSAETTAEKYLSRKLSELAHGHKFLRSIGYYEEVAASLSELICRFGDRRWRLWYVLQKLSSLMAMGYHFINILVMTFGAIAIILWGGSVGVLVAALIMLPAVLAPLQSFPDAADRYLAARQSHGRLCGYLSLINEEFPNEKGMTKHPVAVEFSAISFRYPGSSFDAISAFTHGIAPGEIIAIVGESGGGKTTLINLLLGIYRPTSGNISINGIDIRDVDLDSFRKQVGLVPQDPIIFDGTISDNIKIGAEQASEADIHEAAMRASVHSFIISLPGGYNYEVGEKGSKLSGGQKQRIALARALLRRPSLLILDEATSALDQENENAIQAVLASIRGRQTVLIIAHRLATISNADRVLHISEGKLVGVFSASQWIHSSFLRQAELAKLSGQQAAIPVAAV